MPPRDAGRWRDSPALLAPGGRLRNSPCGLKHLSLLIRQPLRCSAAPKGGSERSLGRFLGCSWRLNYAACRRHIPLNELLERTW